MPMSHAIAAPAAQARPPMAAGRRGSRRFNPYSVAGVLIVLVYVVVYAFFREMLPEKWSVDSAKILEILNYGGTDEMDNSFAVTAALFSIIGSNNLDVFTCASSAVFLFFATRNIRRAGDFFSRLLLIAPCIMLNMFAPSKETVVLIMTMCITVTTIYFRTSKFLTIGAFLGLYAIYGVFVRNYYLLIVGAFFAVHWLWRRPLKYHLLAAILAAGAIMAAPSNLLQTLQSPRDTSNAYAEQIGSDNRTAFTNIASPATGPGFLVNYVYAATVLITPVIYFHTPSDAFMQMMIVAMLLILYKARRRSRRNPGEFEPRFFGSLFVAHILVQLIFEPDLGSFTRHLTSVMLYLIAIKVSGNQRPVAGIPR
ncbi:hypothetical protein [Variovorax atrisoli]|uniref:hypothetical protein n=2 Tax=Variovorax atrisoli TaxID=3394203 RepID=UPI003393A1C8